MRESVFNDGFVIKFMGNMDSSVFHTVGVNAWMDTRISTVFRIWDKELPLKENVKELI
jgi:hypothetical protein